MTAPQATRAMGARGLSFAGARWVYAYFTVDGGFLREGMSDLFIGGTTVAHAESSLARFKRRTSCDDAEVVNLRAHAWTLDGKGYPVLND